MAKTKFKLNHSGVGQLLKSDGLQDVLSSKAGEIRNRAGAGYSQDIYIGKTRANAMVFAETVEAKRDNSKNNTLLKAVR